MIETRPQKTQERALLIGLEKEGVSKWDLRIRSTNCESWRIPPGAKVVDTVTQKFAETDRSVLYRPRQS